MNKTFINSGAQVEKSDEFPFRMGQVCHINFNSKNNVNLITLKINSHAPTDDNDLLKSKLLSSNK